MLTSTFTSTPPASPILAWHGEAGLKQAAIARLKEHRRLDELVQGKYFFNGRGCQLGCLVHTDKNVHAAVERLFGIRERIGHWVESIFEGLPKSDCAQWAIESSEAIPVGADLSKCYHQMVLWVIRESGLLNIDNYCHALCDLIDRACKLHERAIFSDVDETQWPEWSEWSELEVFLREFCYYPSGLVNHFVGAIRDSLNMPYLFSRGGVFRRVVNSAELAQDVYDDKYGQKMWRLIADKSIEIFSNAPVRSTNTMTDNISNELCRRGLWCNENTIPSKYSPLYFTPVLV